MNEVFAPITPEKRESCKRLGKTLDQIFRVELGNELERS